MIEQVRNQPTTMYIKRAGTGDFNLLFWCAGTFYIQALAETVSGLDLVIGILEAKKKNEGIS